MNSPLYFHHSLNIQYLCVGEAFLAISVPQSSSPPLLERSSLVTATTLVTDIRLHAALTVGQNIDVKADEMVQSISREEQRSSGSQKL